MSSPVYFQLKRPEGERCPDRSHYYLSLETKLLKKWAEIASKHVLTFAKKRKPLLVYRGMSGIAYSTALGMALDAQDIDYGRYYVRKENENTHGSPSNISTRRAPIGGNSTESGKLSCSWTIS